MGHLAGSKPGLQFGERLMAKLLKFLNGLHLLRKLCPLSTLILAEKLARAPKILTEAKHLIELDKIFVFERLHYNEINLPL